MGLPANLSKKSAETLDFEVVPPTWLGPVLVLFHALILVPPLVLALALWARFLWTLTALGFAGGAVWRWRQTYGPAPPARVYRTAEGEWFWHREGRPRRCAVHSWWLFPGCVVLTLRPVGHRTRTLVLSERSHGVETQRAVRRVLRLSN